MGEGVTHSLWPCLQAIRHAVERLPPNEQPLAKQNLFHDNAVRVYSF